MNGSSQTADLQRTPLCDCINWNTFSQFPVSSIGINALSTLKSCRLRYACETLIRPRVGVGSRHKLHYMRSCCAQEVDAPGRSILRMVRR